jgi:hypothetical protein
VIVPVWALLDGDTPVSGARVRVYAGGLRAVGRRRPLRQLRGARAERTHRSGVALLEFARLPRSFTVVISGGRSEGRRLRGFLSARVRSYGEGRVVHVNPVTTLVELWRRVNPRVSQRRATRAVARALGIPSWANNVDLRASDRWLDGERFLGHVRVHATLDRATGDLLFDIRRGRRTSRFRARRGMAAAAAQSLGRLTGEPTLMKSHGRPVARAAQAGLIATVFTELGKGVLSGIASQAGGSALGWVLSAFGLQDSNELLRQDIANIRQALDELGKQVTQVQNRLELAGFSELVHQTDRTIGEIDHAMSQLALLANLPADDPTKRGFTRTVVDYIGSHLLDAPAILNQNLSSNVPLSDNLIKSASRLLSVRERFFDKETSEKVQSVYDYFAGYQAKLAILLVEYFHAKPDTYSTTTIKTNLDRIAVNVTAQASSLKPPVPAGVMLDTKTGFMWMQTIDGSSVRKITDVVTLVQPRGKAPYLDLTRFSISTTLPGLPFNEWAMPVAEDLHKLLSDRGNDSPLDFLAKKARITRKVLDAANSHVWIRDTFECRNLFNAAIYRLYSLRDAAVAGETQLRAACQSGVWNDPGWRDRGAAQGILFRRVRPGVDYWWG